MKLQLKNVHFSERLSQETNAFAADVYFEGKKFGAAENDGHGGCTFIQPYPDSRELYNTAAKYAKSLPNIETNLTHGIDGKPYSIESDLEAQVDDLFGKWLEKKEIQKNSIKGIFYQKPNGTRATTYWKGHTMAKLLKRPDGIALIKKAVEKLKSEGNTILNTNLGSILD